MITSFNIRYNNSFDLEELEIKTAGKPTENILIQVFSGVLEQSRLLNLIDEIQQILPGVSIIGTSTGGEIADGQSLEEQIIISTTLFEHTRVKTTITFQNDDLSTAGSSIAQDLKHDNTKVAIVFGCGLKNKKTIKGQALLNAIHKELPDTLIAGGQAGDNGDGNITFVFTEQGLTENGVVAAALIGDRISASSAYNLSWVPIGKKFTITKVENSRVYSINHQTPYDIYCHYLGQEIADNLPLSAAEFPFIIEKDGTTMAIHAIGMNDDGSFEYVHDFHVGEQVRFGFCHTGLLASGARETKDKIAKHAPQALFVYSCVSRKWILGADIAVDLSVVAGNVPSAGFFCYGEYYLLKNKPHFFSQTMTVLSLTESHEHSKIPSSKAHRNELIDEHSRLFRTIRVLHKLIDTSTKEVESMNKELATLVRVDPLTGLSNRREFDEKLQKSIELLAGNSIPLSILMLDVDYFKAYNDTYGHVSGDSCLRGVAEVLNNVMAEQSYTAARYGGEEFLCLLPEVSHTQATEIAENILNKINNLKIEHRSSSVANHVTVSIGLTTVFCDSGTDPDKLVHDCDKLLYEAKKKGRNQIMSEDVS